MLFSSIIVIALLQSDNFLHFQLTMKMSVMEKKTKEKATENSIRLLTIRYPKKLNVGILLGTMKKNISDS